MGSLNSAVSGLLAECHQQSIFNPNKIADSYSLILFILVLIMLFVFVIQIIVPQHILSGTLTNANMYIPCFLEKTLRLLFISALPQCGDYSRCGIYLRKYGTCT